LDSPDQGSVFIHDKDINQMKDRAKSRVRRSEIGFVFQFHYLLEEFTVLENALMPIIVRHGTASKEDCDWVEYILERVGMSAR
jgi:lipoprotein-releasing system ATP-binding protein